MDFPSTPQGAQVPQGWQAEAFAGKSPTSLEDPQPAPGPTPLEMIQDGLKALPKAGYDASQAAGIKSALRKAQNETPVAIKGLKQNAPYPIGLALKVNGVAGVGFGHVVSIASLKGTRWNGNTVFTVTRVVHTVQNQDWTTDIETVARYK